MFNSSVLRPIVLPHAVKVAVFLFVSAGLAAILNGLGSFNLSPIWLVILTAVINWLLAILKNWYDASKDV
jgi:hypothetical protein